MAEKVVKRYIYFNWKVGQYRYSSEHGKSSAYFTCPICDTATKCYIWSLSGGGKKCRNRKCKGVLNSNGVSIVQDRFEGSEVIYNGLRYTVTRVSDRTDPVLSLSLCLGQTSHIGNFVEVNYLDVSLL